MNRREKQLACALQSVWDVASDAADAQECGRASYSDLSRALACIAEEAAEALADIARSRLAEAIRVRQPA